MNQEEYERNMQSQMLMGQANQNALAAQQQVLLQEQEKGLAEEQLDVEPIIERIYNLLQGMEYKEVGEGQRKWVKPEFNMQVLSDWGIHRIMQMVRFHITKNTLLSNYEEEQINWRMYRFMTELNDLMLLKYEKLFREPTFEECKAVFESKIQDKIKLRKYTKEILGFSSNEKEIRGDVLKEMESRIEYEMNKIKEQIRKEQLKEYGMLLEEIESQILSTYNRAYKGKERETLRRHTTFSEIRALQPEQSKGGLFGWGKKS